ncbi:ferredoxin reductase [Mycobacterium sp. DL440]|uniref:ferredoxin reductase n=1 Tax=Mycobacterium sp. DL440 TaxID=2675523 RepID=UPI00141E97F9|nr:ferredoxin reductase [Mycobacterium sp. DL440]
MFTQTLTEGVGRRLLAGPRLSALANLLTGPHGVDRYTELVEPTWTRGDARAKVIAVRRQTPRSVTLTLEPNAAFAGFRAGQHINLSVEINGRRRTRCYSPASAEGAARVELTIGRHDGGLVSTYLCDHAYPGMVLGLDSVGGDFVLPAVLPKRILFVSGGSGVTPVMSMLRTLRGQAFTGEVAFVHYARGVEEACYLSELAAMGGAGVRVLHGYTRDGDGPIGDLDGYFDPAHLAAAFPDAEPDAVFVCGPPALVDAVRTHCPDARSESFVPPVFSASGESTGGTVTFTNSSVTVTDDGQTLLAQAEAAGLTPENGCRMGICHSCTRSKSRGAVRNLITGAVSSADSEDIQICVTAPIGDVDIDL